MDSVKFNLDKQNRFRYNLNVEGVPMNEVHSRVSLYLKNGINLFFNSKLEENTGTCVCTIPKLENMLSDDIEGQLVVETVAGKTFFKLYECPIAFKTSVKVSIDESSVPKSGGFFQFEDAEEPTNEMKVSIDIPAKEDLSEENKSKETSKVEESNKEVHNPLPQDYSNLDWDNFISKRS
jgi:hypothetical protein